MTTTSASAPPPCEAEAETFYTRARVTWLYFRWDWLTNAAEGRQALGYTVAPTWSRGRENDRRFWAAVQADLEAAQEAFGRGSLEWQVIELRKRGFWLDTIASNWHKDAHWLRGLHSRTMLKAAYLLGWREPGTEQAT